MRLGSGLFAARPLAIAIDCSKISSYNPQSSHAGLFSDNEIKKLLGITCFYQLVLYQPPGNVQSLGGILQNKYVSIIDIFPEKLDAFALMGSQIQKRFKIFTNSCLAIFGTVKYFSHI